MNYEIADEHKGHKFFWYVIIRPSSYPPTPKTHCTSCGGGGHRRTFGGYDDDYNGYGCSTCKGTGLMDAKSDPWEPPIPPKLREALTKVVRDYWNEIQNENFKLE